MNPETVALIMTTIGGVMTAVKAIAEARKAKYEAARAEAEASRADEAEKTTTAVIGGVENAKRTLAEQNLAQYLEDEIQDVATSHGVEENLNKIVKRAKSNTFDKAKLLDKLNE